MREAAINVNARPHRVDLDLYAGDDTSIRITVNNTDGTPADLTDTTATAQIRATHTAVNPVADFTTLVDPAGVVYLSLDAATTAALPARAVWDCQIQAPLGQTTTIAAGNVRTAQEVTR